MEDLDRLIAACYKKGINVCMDFVMNHILEEHEWARKARQGGGEYMSRYFFFDNAEIPAQYERTVVRLGFQCRGNTRKRAADKRTYVWQSAGGY